MNIHNNYSLAICTKNFTIFCAKFLLIFIDKENYICYIRATKGKQNGQPKGRKEKRK